ncbi:MAG: GNAT family N-acetyltransferase, partial [bacterium]
VEIRPLAPDDHSRATDFFGDADRVFTLGREYFLFELSGFVAVQETLPIGLITYHMEGTECQIVTINSQVEGMGIGTELLKAVIKTAVAAGCERVRAGVTNDNVDALRFFQTRGFILAALNRNITDSYRQRHPSYPGYGMHSIPIRDEIEVEMNF